MESFSHSKGFQCAVESMIGGRKENQDSYGMSDTRLGMLVVVCDGMGGGPAGKTASMLATQAIIDYVSGADPTSSPISILEDAGVAANCAVKGAVTENISLKGMGTTCVCLLITDAEAYIMHIGDSRCYQLRGGKMVFRTADHSYVGELVRRGSITEEEARNSSYSNVITRAIGVGDDERAEVDVVAYKPGDRFALMTDGIWGSMPEPQLVVLLSSNESPASLVVDVATRVDNIGYNEGGGHDNLTLAVADVPGSSATQSRTINDVFSAGGSTVNDRLGSDSSDSPTLIPEDAPDSEPITRIRNNNGNPPKATANPETGEKKRKKSVKWLVVLLAIIAAAAIAACCYFIGSIYGPKTSDNVKVEKAEEKVETDAKGNPKVSEETQKAIETITNDKINEEEANKPSPKEAGKQQLNKAIESLGKLKDFNKDRSLKDPAKVKEKRDLLYEEVVRYIILAKDQSPRNEEFDKMFEELKEYIRNGQVKGKLTGFDRKHYLSTKDSMDEIEECTNKINKVINSLK